MEACSNCGIELKLNTLKEKKTLKKCIECKKRKPSVKRKKISEYEDEIRKLKEHIIFLENELNNK